MGRRLALHNNVYVLELLELGEEVRDLAPVVEWHSLVAGDRHTRRHAERILGLESQLQLAEN
eukprot:6876750-Heterocapsa_arctica.AAC.1